MKTLNEKKKVKIDHPILYFPKAKTNAGNLVLSLGEKQDETEMRKNVEKIIDVATGNLILFPASLSHYTIPFESDEERIVLAFDVIPE